jgi:hypothetical protein
VCKRGHSLTDLDNVRVEKDGRHSCRACERVRAAAKRAGLQTKRNDDRNSTTHPVPPRPCLGCGSTDHRTYDCPNDYLGNI